MWKRVWVALMGVVLGLGAGAALAETVQEKPPATEKPLRVLIVSGGGWHDYKEQREILETGLKARLNVSIDHVYYDMSPGEDNGLPKLPIFGNPNYGDGYDVIIHNECAAGVTDIATIDAVLAPHIKGIPAVNLHCAMHSYRVGNWQEPVDKDAVNARWYAFTGMQSTGHGPQAPIVLNKVSNAPILEGLEMWTTPDEELYNTLTDFGVVPLIAGTQPDMPDANWQGKVFTVAWLHWYGPKRTRVFSTTLAHNEASMRDARYLDLVARGVMWAADREAAVRVAPTVSNAACADPAQKVDEKAFVSIGGIEQWLTIKGDSCANPVILMLHGGPGNPLSPYADNLYAGWEKDFTLVQWDQRGSGMTFGRNRPDEDTPLTLEQMRDDGLEVASYLTQRVGQDKVILMGGSWGSVLGVEMISARPDLFHAYLGSSQLVSYAENPSAAYELTLAKATAAQDQDSIEKLTTIGAPPWTAPRNSGVMRRITRAYEARATDSAPADWWIPAPEYATPQALADYEGGEEYSFINFVGFKGDGIYSTVDFNASATRFEVPVFLVQGAEDLVTTPEVSKRWFDRIEAPQKAYILLPRTGHDPNPAMVEAQYRVLIDQIVPLIKP